MKHLPSGEVMLVNLPGVGTLFSRSWALYKELFQKLIILTALFGIGAFLNVSIQDSLNALVRDGSAFAQSFVHVLNTAVNIAISGFYFSFIFAAMVYLVHEKHLGRTLTLAESFEMARERYSALFFVGLLLFFVMNGGFIAIVMPFFFSVWFYFAAFIVLLDKERGIWALAKSRYLVHGMFFRVLGRYAAAILLLFLAFSVVWLLLLVPILGWALFSVGFLALALVAFPFFILYEYLRYQDLVAVERSIPFHPFQGERVGIMVWALLGLAIALMAWSYDMLGTQGRARFSDVVILRIADAILPVTIEWNKNIDKSSEFLERLKILSPTTSE